MGMHDGVSKVWILRYDRGLDIDGHSGDLEAIASLIRHALVQGHTRVGIEQVIAKALTHLDEQETNEPDGDAGE